MIIHIQSGCFEFRLRRDSVCMGDDTSAPHEALIYLAYTDDSQTLFTQILEKYHIPSIGNWAFKLNNELIAVFKYDVDNDSYSLKFRFVKTQIQLRKTNEIDFYYDPWVEDWLDRYNESKRI